MPAETRQQLVDRLRIERDPVVLGRYVHHAAWQVRWAAIQALGESGSAGAEAPLLAVLRDNDPKDFPLANAALGKVLSKAAIPALAALVHHRIDDVKASAMAALGSLGDPSLTPIYLDALTDRSWVARARVVRGDVRPIG